MEQLSAIEKKFYYIGDNCSMEQLFECLIIFLCFDAGKVLTSQ